MMSTRHLFMLLLVVAACGGGGAAVQGPESSDPASNPDPSNPPLSGNPSSAIVTTPGTSFSPATITITPGATVTWQISGATHNVTFGSAKPTGGDILDARSGTQVDRSFATAGTYDYQCTRHSGMVGRVVVTADGSSPANPPSSPTQGILVDATATAFSPERVEIAPGGVVTWQFGEGAGGIVFDDDDATPSGGDIPPAVAGTRVSRTFSSPGDYDYHSTRSSDIRGRVRVR
jgi:plastocyanin